MSIRPWLPGALLLICLSSLTSCGWSRLSEAAAGTVPPEPEARTVENETSLRDGEQLGTAPQLIDQIDGEPTTATLETTTTTVATTTTAPPARLFGNMIAPSETRSVWSGSIGEGSDAQGVSLWLAERGDFILGEITNEATGSIRTLAGKRLSDGMYLHEFARDGRIASTFTASSIVDGTFTGLAAGARPASFTLDAFVEDESAFAGGLHAGSYGYAFAPFEGAQPCCGPHGSLRLANLDSGSATVEITTQTGAPLVNVAVIEPTTVDVWGISARFEERTDWLDCAFDITGFGDVVFVEHVAQRWECGFGRNASVEGIYVRTGS